MKRIKQGMALMAMALLVGCASHTTQPLEVGDRVLLTGLQNQFDEPFTEQSTMAALMFVDSMATKDWARSSLTHINAQCMTEGKLVYLADISGMPGFISDRVAVPKMRAYAYPIWLDRDGQVSSKLPTLDDHVTVLRVENDVVTSANFYPNASALTHALVGLCGPHGTL